jgi:hypothetical protein
LKQQSFFDKTVYFSCKKERPAEAPFLFRKKLFCKKDCRVKLEIAPKNYADVYKLYFNEKMIYRGWTAYCEVLVEN